MLKSYTAQKALRAAYDYRHNLHNPGTPGYEFWSKVIVLLEKADALG